MNNEEKILEVLTQMQGQIAQMQGQMTQMQGDISGLGGRMERLETGQAAMEGRMERIKGDLTFVKLRLEALDHKQAAVEGRMGRLESAQAQAQEELHMVKAYLELDVEKRFDGVNEGIDLIQETLELRESVDDRVDKLEDDVVALKTAVKAHTRDIAELKKAQ